MPGDGGTVGTLKLEYKGAGHVQARGGRREGERPAGATPFTPEYKLGILQEIDQRRGEGKGVVSEIMSREGLYASQVASWRSSLEEVIAKGLPEGRRGRKVDYAACGPRMKNPAGGPHALCLY